MNQVLSATLLRRPVGLGRSNDRDDIRTLKTMLHRIGQLPEPEETFSGDFDTPLEKAVTGFQQENGLAVDGRLMPGGETEHTLRRAVRNSPPAFAVRPGDLALSGRVGAGGDPAVEETGPVAKTLANLGFLAPRKADEIGRGDGKARFVLENAVRDFQMSEALDPDCRLEPGGPTVTALKRAASNQMSGGEGEDRLEGGEDDDIVEPQLPEPDPGDAGGNGRDSDGPAGAPPRIDPAIQPYLDFFRDNGPLSPGKKIKDDMPMTPHPDDPRFDENGNPRPDNFSGDPEDDGVVAWGLANTGINPKTGDIDYFGNIEGFERDPKTGRWKKSDGKSVEDKPKEDDNKPVVKPFTLPPDPGFERKPKPGNNKPRFKQPPKLPFVLKY